MFKKENIALNPGDIVGSNRYEIIEKIGEGGMSLVYTCKRKDLHAKIFAIKVFNSKTASIEDRERFQNEINVVLDVSHKNIIRAYDFIEDGSITAYTMEYVDGGTLKDIINKKENNDYDSITELLLQLVEGVSSLHSQNIIHRDLKPENILLTKDINIKLSDFGISSNLESTQEENKDEIVGSKDYLPPEYVTDRMISFQTDIYSIGIIAYQLITGLHPFESESIFQNLFKQTNYSFKPIRAIRIDCPYELSKIVMKCLEAKPSDRYSSCAELLIDLQDLHNGKVKSESILVSNIKGKSGGVKTNKPEEKSNFKVEEKTLLNKSEYKNFSIHFIKKSNKRGRAILSLIKKIALLFTALSIFMAILYYNNDQFRGYVNHTLLEENKIIGEKNLSTVKATSKVFTLIKSDNKQRSKIEVDIKKGDIIDLKITIVPKEKDSGVYPVLKRVEMKKSLLVKVDSNIYRGFLDVEYIYDMGEGEKSKKTKGKFFGMIFGDTAIATVHYFTPDNLDISKTENNYSLNLEQGDVFLNLHDSISFNLSTKTPNN